MKKFVEQIARMSTTAEADGADLGNDMAMDGLIVRAREIIAHVEPFRCKGCGRPEDDCSADPCPDVIEDREATA